MTQFAMAATNQSVIGRTGHVKVDSESSGEVYNMMKTGRHQISLVWLVPAMANWVASQPLSSDELKSV